jgi:hypothetical protein
VLLCCLLQGREMATTIGDMFVKPCTEGDSTSDASCDNAKGPKFVAVGTGSEVGMTCKAATPPCSSTCTGTSCPLCCQSLWPVLDGGVWVGWMARVSFDIPSPYEFLEETLVVHL